MSRDAGQSLAKQARRINAEEEDAEEGHKRGLNFGFRGRNILSFCFFVQAGHSCKLESCSYWETLA